MTYHLKRPREAYLEPGAHWSEGLTFAGGARFALFGYAAATAWGLLPFDLRALLRSLTGS